MAITQTPAVWTFTAGVQTFGPYPTVERDLSDLMTLLADPRTRSAMAGQGAAAAQPAVRVKRLWSDTKFG